MGRIWLLITLLFAAANAGPLKIQDLHPDPIKVYIVEPELTPENINNKPIVKTHIPPSRPQEIIIPHINRLSSEEIESNVVPEIKNVHEITRVTSETSTQSTGVTEEVDVQETPEETYFENDKIKIDNYPEIELSPETIAEMVDVAKSDVEESETYPSKPDKVDDLEDSEKETEVTSEYFETTVA